MYILQDAFLGEILGAIIFSGDKKTLNSTFQVEHLRVIAEGRTQEDGQVIVDTRKTKGFKVLEDFDIVSCYNIFAEHLDSREQSAIIGSFDEQKRLWSSP